MDRLGRSTTADIASEFTGNLDYFAMNDRPTHLQLPVGDFGAKKLIMSKDQADRNLQERVAMAMCGCDTFTMHPLTRSEDGALHLPNDEGFVRHEHVCVCARDGRRPVNTILRCADMLLKAEAALAVTHS